MLEPGDDLAAAPLALGRYELHDAIAAGGMATVHIGVVKGAEGFSRAVAIKRLHPNMSRDPEFAAMFADEARVASRIRHPNVLPTLDVVRAGGELLLVMEYVHGESLAALLKNAAKAGAVPVPLPIASAIIVGCLNGLQAAHEARDEKGQPLDVVHRDVSPQNILVGADGVVRVVDFGIAKATGRAQTTRDGQIKGKLGYMAPEQFAGGKVTRRVDVFAAAIVLWQMVTGRSLFTGEDNVALVEDILFGSYRSARKIADVPEELDRILERGLARDPNQRFDSAAEMAQAVEACIPPASAATLSTWVKCFASATLEARAQMLARVEAGTGSSPSEGPSTSAAVAQENQAPNRSEREVTAVTRTLVTTGGASGAAPAVAPVDSSASTRARRPLAIVGVLAVVVVVVAGGTALLRPGAQSSAMPAPTTTSPPAEPQPVVAAPSDSATAAAAKDAPEDRAPPPPTAASAARSSVPPRTKPPRGASPSPSPRRAGLPAGLPNERN